MTLAITGQALLLAGFIACLVGMYSGVRAAQLHGADRGVWDTRVHTATWVVFGTSLTAAAVLIAALVNRTYAIDYVANHTSTALPTSFAATALWAGQEGSLLLWLVVLATYAVMARRLRTWLTPRALTWMSTTLLATALLFSGLITFVARPFGLAEVEVVDGSGLAPALQNYWMVIHPPFLYLGYVAVAIPFAVMVGSLLANDAGDGWAAGSRSWALWGWLTLLVGLALGGRWAYEEIGWGGYWAWDPVENAALMPWLVLTAFVHSIQAQARRGIMRFWNAVLITMAFALSIFGTFLTRSGILSSVHSFVESPVGWYFLCFLAIVVFGATWLLWRSRKLLRPAGDIEHALSRETTFLLNNIALLAIALAVLWGILYPIISDAIGTVRTAFEPAYYNSLLLLIGLPLLVVMALGPATSWRRATPAGVWRRLGWPLAVAVGAGIALMALGYGSSPVAVATIGLGVLVIAGIMGELVRAVRARRAGRGEGVAIAGWRVVTGNRPRWGGYLVHIGVGLMVIAMAGNGFYRSSIETSMQPGDTDSVAGYDITYGGMERERGANAMRARAVFSVELHGRDVGSIASGRNFYPVSGEVSNEVGIRHRYATGEDLFIIVDELGEDGTIAVQMLVNPLINLLWLACAVMIAGGIVALWPGGRARQRPHPSDGSTVQERSDGVQGDHGLPLVSDDPAASGELLPVVRR